MTEPFASAEEMNPPEIRLTVARGRKPVAVWIRQSDCDPPPKERPEATIAWPPEPVPAADQVVKPMACPPMLAAE